MGRNVGRDLLVWTIGIMVGATLGINLDEQYFTGTQDVIFALVGALVGGLTAYIAHDIVGFAKGVARAFSATWNGAGRALTRLLAWRPSWLYWRGFVKVLGASLLSVGSFIGVAFVSDGFNLNDVSDVSFLACMTITVSTIFTIFTVSESLRRQGDGRWRPTSEEINSICHALILYINLVAGAVWLVIGIVYVVRRIPSAIMWAVAQGPLVKKFIVLTFRHVHNEQRLTSFVVAGIGAFAGTVMGSVWMGLAFGLPFGVILAYVIAPVIARIQIPDLKGEEEASFDLM